MFVTHTITQGSECPINKSIHESEEICNRLKKNNFMECRITIDVRPKQKKKAIEYVKIKLPHHKLTKGLNRHEYYTTKQEVFAT